MEIDKELVRRHFVEAFPDVPINDTRLWEYARKHWRTFSTEPNPMAEYFSSPGLTPWGQHLLGKRADPNMPLIMIIGDSITPTDLEEAVKAHHLPKETVRWVKVNEIKYFWHGFFGKDNFLDVPVSPPSVILTNGRMEYRTMLSVLSISVIDEVRRVAAEWEIPLIERLQFFG